MRYQVSVEQVGGAGRITLLDGDDGEKASQLAEVLVGAASGASFEVVISVEADGAQGGAKQQQQQQQQQQGQGRQQQQQDEPNAQRQTARPPRGSA